MAKKPAKKKTTTKTTTTTTVAKKRKFKRVPLPLGGFPDRKACRLRYCDFIILDADANGSATPKIHHFRANSLYDPDVATGGHQPRGFDEHAAIYDHYTVIGSKIKVTFESDVDHTASVGQYCFVMLQDTNSTPSDLTALLEGSVSNTKVSFRPRNTNTGKSVTLTQKYSPYKMFGIPKKDSLITMDELSPRCGANPLEDAIFTIGVFCQRTSSTNPPPIVCRVEIEYIVVFSEKRPMGGS